MKINLTKLLEKSDIKNAQDMNERTTDASYYIKPIRDRTSMEDAYSFELEEKSKSSLGKNTNQED